MRRLANEHHDLIVVGGGVHGAFAAWQAARWGWRVALLERDDFGSGTSSNSLRIAHGGLRYLQTMDVARLRASVRERAALRALAPALVRPLPCVLPTSGSGSRSRLALAAALQANELLSMGASGEGDARFPRGRTIDAAEYRSLAGAAAVEGATGAALWYDGLIESPERLLVALVLAAEREGATVLNHAEVVSLLESGGRASGVRVRRTTSDSPDAGDGEVIVVHASAVLMCAGPWVGNVLPDTKPQLVRACNLLFRVPPEILPGVAAALPLPREHRMLFAVPWSGRLMTGTSYSALPHDADVRSALADPGSDIETLLADVQDAAPALGLTREDVMVVHVGLLPGTTGEHGAVPLDRPVLVDHAASGGPAGLVSLQGVKWTTARAVSRQALELCARSVSRERTPRGGGTRDDHGVLVPEADPAAVAARVGLLPRRSGRGGGLAGRIAARLTRLRGSHAGEVLALASAEPSLAEPLAGGEVLAAEVVHSIRREHARTLRDLILRRLELGTAGPPAEDTLLAVALVAGAELGWDESRRNREVASVRALYPGFST